MSRLTVQCCAASVVCEIAVVFAVPIVLALVWKDLCVVGCGSIQSVRLNAHLNATSRLGFGAYL